MTIEDAKIIGFGSLALLIVFLTAGAIYASGSFNLWTIVRRYVMVKIADWDGSEDNDPGAGASAVIVVPSQQHQVAPELVPTFEVVKAYLTDRTLTDDEAIELLALARRSNGDDLLSANKIRDIVGGNEGKVKAHVAAHRKPRPKPKTITRIERPVGGWN